VERFEERIRGIWISSQWFSIEPEKISFFRLRSRRLRGVLRGKGVWEVVLDVFLQQARGVIISQTLLCPGRLPFRML
jgi:hypothetical protein